MFAPINLEATVNLLDIDSDCVPSPIAEVSLVIRQSVEVLVSGDNGHPEAVVFIEFKEGQIRALVWDKERDPMASEPIIHVLKNIKAADPGEALRKEFR